MNTPWPRYRLAFVCLMAAVTGVFWRHLFTDDVPFFRDIAFFHFPRAVELRETVRSGLLPLWNHAEHFGEPVIANANYLLFYPTSWLAWILPAAYGFKLHYVLHFFALAAGAFFLARHAGLGPFACFVAGALFVFSGPIMSLGNFYNVLPAAAWIAPAVLACDYLMRNGGWRGATLFAATMTLQLFAGEPFTSIGTTGLTLAWAITFYGDFHAAPWAGANRRLFLRYASSFAILAGLTAVQVFPALYHMRFTERAAQFRYVHTFFWSMHPLKFIEMLLPDFWGAPLADEGVPWLFLEGSEPFFLLSMFIGIVPVALATAALFTRRDRTTLFWAASGVGFVLLALGRFTPLSYVFYDVIPIFRIVRFPVKLILPATLALALLAAIAVDRLMREDAAPASSRGMRWIANALYGLAAFWVAASAFMLLAPATAKSVAAHLAALEFDHERTLRVGSGMMVHRTEILNRASQWIVDVVPLRLAYVVGSTVLAAIVLRTSLAAAAHRRLLVALSLAAVAQLAFTHYWLNPIVTSRFYSDPIPAMRHIPANAGPAPVRIYTQPAFGSASQMGKTLLIDIGKVDFLPPIAQVPYTFRLNMQASWGLAGVENSFTADPEHILLGDQGMVNRIVYDRGMVGVGLTRLLRLGSVDYAFFNQLDAPPGMELIGIAENATTMPARVYRVTDTMPRAYLVSASGAIRTPEPYPAMQLLMSDHFDPRRQVLIDDPQPSTGAADVPAGEARLLRRNSLRTEISATVTQPAYLVLTDSYNPEWVVEVDGQRAPLLRANLMFRGVALQPGEHRVVFRYRPLSLAAGFLVSLLTLVLAASFTLVETVRLRTPRTMHAAADAVSSVS